jgi:hypothetical protein
MDFSSAEVSIIVAAMSLLGVMFSLGWNTVQQQRLAELQRRLKREEEAESKAAQATRLVNKFRDPLLESAFDLQSRLYNTLSKTSTFSWPGNDDYYLPSTLFLVGQFFGWVEILRRNMLYSDIANIGEAKQLLVRVRKIQTLFSGTSEEYRDHRYIYRVEQRAIGEIMIDEGVAGDGDLPPGTIGYATFRRSLGDDEFSRWFARFKAGLDVPPAPGEPDRLRAIQIALIDLIDFLDPHQERFPDHRSRLPGDTKLANGPRRES